MTLGRQHFTDFAVVPQPGDAAGCILINENPTSENADEQLISEVHAHAALSFVGQILNILPQHTAI